MTVYVDELLGWGRIPGGGRATHWCHLMSDSIDELHAMADKIGLKREWFQVSKSGIPHYDITPSRRALAVKAGAQPAEATLEFLARMRCLSSI